MDYTRGEFYLIFFLCPTGGAAINFSLTFQVLDLQVRSIGGAKMRGFPKLISAVLSSLAILVGASAAHAATINLHADFDGLQMTPPNASPAFGAADVTLNDVTGAFSVTTGTYQDLLGGANAVNLNGPAAPGVGGAFIMALTLDTPGAMSGTFSGGGTITAGQITAMSAGDTYLRIISSVYPGGEIRGQLFVVPEPTSAILLGLGGFSVLATARRNRKRTASSW